MLPVDLKLKFEKVGGDFVCLKPEELEEIGLKLSDINDCFNHPTKLTGEVDILETTKHSIFLKKLYGQKTLFIKRHQPWTDAQPLLRVRQFMKQKW